MGPTPVRASGVEAALAGAADLGTVKAAAAGAGEATSPPSDISGSAEYRRHLAGVLTGRAVAAAAGHVVLTSAPGESVALVDTTRR